jgi:hypothetical protein
MIEYGFATESSSEDVRAKTKVWYDVLNATEQEVFHQHIPFVLMSTGIGAICSVSSVHIARRLAVNNKAWLLEHCGWLHLDNTDAVNAFAMWLSTKLTGYRTNCGYATNAAWLRRHLRTLPKADEAAEDDVVRFRARAGYLPPASSREIKEMHRVFDAERKDRLDATVVEVCVEVPA